MLLLAVAVAAGCARHSGDFGNLPPGKSPAFETRIELDVGTNVQADYVVSDFDGDAVLDMAVISLNGQLNILLGNRADFTMDQSEDLGGVPAWIDSGDFDNDGDQDLAIVRSAADTTDIWLNDGNGTFTAAGSVAVGLDALALAVGDLNNDGNIDIAVSRPSAPELEVAFGDGMGGFTGPQPLFLPGGGTPFGLAIGDATRDGLADLLVADTTGDRILIYSGYTTNTFGNEVCELLVPGTPGAVTLGDLSGDGLADLVVSAFDANRYVVITDVLPPEGKGGNGFPNVSTCSYQSFDVLLPARPSLATVADVTGDGINDLVACLAFTASIAVGHGLQGGGIGELEVLDATGFPLRPFVGDFDGNGRNDVFVLSGNGNRVNLWLARGSGTLAGARNYPSGLSGASWIDGADFDGDGDFEVVTGNNADPNLAFLGSDAGKLQLELTMNVGHSIYQIEAGDLDLDGRPDLVLSVPGGIKVLQNQSTPGSYAFAVLPGFPMTIASGEYPFGITLGDFDRDGDIDIAVCDYVGGGLHIVPGTPDAFVFGPEVIVNVGGGPVDVAAADFTGDGLVDLAVSRLGQANIAVLQNQGNLAFVEMMALPVGQSPNYLVTADFNRDGRADLVVSNATSGTISVLFGSQNGFSGNSYAAGSAPTALLARDLTGDGIDDILVASLVSGDFRVLVGDGNGSFPLLPSFPGTLGASDAVLQDMTGDGLPDLMISSLITNRVSLVRNIQQQ